MCIHGHPDRYRSKATGDCRICHAQSTNRWRGTAPKRPRYRINRELFKRMTCHKHWSPKAIIRVLAQVGISEDCLGRLYRSRDYRDAARREKLAELLGVSHDDLWLRVI